MNLLQPIILKRILLGLTTLLFLGFSTPYLNGQTVFWSEDFETDGTGTRYTADHQFIDNPGRTAGSEDYFGRCENTGTMLQYVGCTTAKIDVTAPYTGQSGSFFMAGEDLDDAIGSGGCGNVNGNIARNVSFTGINISEASEMTFKILVAVGTSTMCNTSFARWDLGEGLKIYYTKDGATEEEALCFAPDLDCEDSENNNARLKTDPNCDGDANEVEGVIVTNVFTEYSFTIPTGGSSLELRVEIVVSAGDEEIAFDNLRLEAVTVPVLPVELSHFGAKLKNKEVNIEWATATETNNSYFLIEHSTDGRRFLEIGTVEGAGDSFEHLDYHFPHNNPSQGINYYRLVQFDHDGTFTYSKIVSVRVKENETAVTIAPNPFSNITEIRLSKSSKQDSPIVIFDLLGRQVLTSVIKKDNLTKSLDLSTLQAGIYTLVIGEGEQAVIKKISKLKQ